MKSSKFKLSPRYFGLVLLAFFAAEPGFSMQPPPNRENAIRSEFKMIEKMGRKEDYELFIRRHAHHHLAAIAKQRIKALRKH